MRGALSLLVGIYENEGCGTVHSWHTASGTIEGVDLSRCEVAIMATVPHSGAASASLYIDDEVTPEQEEALLNAWTGKLGGPVVELTWLFGEVIYTARTLIAFRTDRGKGTLAIGRAFEVDTAPLWEAEGRSSTTHEGVPSTASGSAADTTAEWSEARPPRSIALTRQTSGSRPETLAS